MAHDLFPEWYSRVSIGSDEQICQKRIAAIDGFGKSTTVRQVLTLVRLLAGRPAVEREVRILRNRFLKHDQFLPMRGNDEELRVLSGAALVEIMASSQDGADVVAAIALKCSLQMFSGNLAIPEIPEIVENSMRRMADSVREPFHLKTVRNRQLTNELTNLKRVAKALDAATAPLRRETFAAAFDDMVARANDAHNLYDQIVRNQLIMEEELNLLWWAFGGELETPIELDSPGRDLVIARELAGLVRLCPAPHWIRSFINRFRAKEDGSASEQVSVKAAIDSLPREWREEWAAEFCNSPALDLCPLLLAVQSSLLTYAAEDWPPVYERTSDLKLESMAALNLVHQVLNEQLLIRSVADGSD